MVMPVAIKGKTAVILFSGGMDSAVAAAMAKVQGRQLHGLAVNYGQRHQRELKAARAMARTLKFKSFQIVDLPMKKIAAGSLVDGGKIRSSGVKPGRPSTYVSFRNGALLSVAVALADQLDASEIWGGWCKTDRNGYSDCRPVFLKAFQRAASLGLGRPIKIKAPLLGLNKAATIRKGLKLGLDFGKTWTCYLGKARPCKKCDACRLRARGFEVADRVDPLIEILNAKY